MLTYEDEGNCDCWVCKKHIYSLIFWSKSIYYQLNDDSQFDDFSHIKSLLG